MATLKTKIQLRNDSAANWLKADVDEKPIILGAGEVGIESDTNKMKLGDGTTRWKDLPYFKGDIDLTNLNATNVFFKKDVVFTESVGTVTVDEKTGSTTVEAADKSIDEFLRGLFAKEDAAELTTQPSLTVSGNGVASVVEVGTTITPNAKTSFNAGKYKYGPETGVTASGYKITSVTVPAESVDANTATFNKYKLASENAVYQVKAECTCSNGANPKSNIGTEYPDQKITEHLVTAKNTTICTARYKNFYGHIADPKNKVEVSAAGLTSAVIRKLQLSQWSNEAPKSSYDIGEKWMQFIYAIPAGKKSSMTAKDSNNITFTVQKITECKVELPDGTLKDYDVFVIDNAAQYGATKVQMSWK